MITVVQDMYEPLAFDQVRKVYSPGSNTHSIMGIGGKKEILQMTQSVLC